MSCLAAQLAYNGFFNHAVKQNIYQLEHMLFFLLYSGYSLSQSIIFSFFFFFLISKDLELSKHKYVSNYWRLKRYGKGSSASALGESQKHTARTGPNSLHKEHTNTKTNCRENGDRVSKSRCFWTSQSSHMLNIHWRLHDSTTCTQVVLRNYNPLKMFFDLWFCVNFQTCVVFKRYIYNW